MTTSPAEGVVYMTIRRDKKGKVAATRVTKNRPIPKAGDVVLRLQLRIPDPAFRWLLTDDDSDMSLGPFVKRVEVAA